MTNIDYDSIAEIYDLYASAEYDVSYFLKEAGKVRGNVLELMAGTGRISIPLLEAGAQLTCVDASEGMLRVLSRKLQKRGLHAEVRQADVRNLELPAAFDLAILPSQSFSELLTDDDQEAAMRSINASLRAGARFICTLYNPLFRGKQVDGVLRLSGRYPTNDGTLVVSGFEQGGDPVVTRLQFFDFYGADGRLVERRMLEMKFTLVEKYEFEALAKRAGYHVVSIYGDYEYAPFDPASSVYMIFELETS